MQSNPHVLSSGCWAVTGTLYELRRDVPALREGQHVDRHSQEDEAAQAVEGEAETPKLWGEIRLYWKPRYRRRLVARYKVPRTEM